MYISLQVDIAFQGIDDLLNNIMQDQKRFLTKKILRIPR